MNLAHIGNNNNKFYQLQLIETSRNGQTLYWCATRWGRNGADGKNLLYGPDHLSTMIEEYRKKFKDKTGLAWEDRHEEPRNKKYTFLESEYERAYNDDDGDDKQARDEMVNASEPASKLPAPVQSLVKLIFNQTSFDVTLNSIGYDANKLPLGKLGKNTLTKAFRQLVEIEAMLQDPDEAQMMADDSSHDGDVAAYMEELSNRYYSYIPHISPGFQRLPLIDNMERLETEIDMLETLEKMEVTAGLADKAKKQNKREHEEKIALLDRHLDMLKLDQVAPVEPGSTEYKTLLSYLVNTSGYTHDVLYNVQDIFRIRRQGEWERFEKECGNRPNSCRRLLWHGSRTNNFGGILSQGLRIAPSEAPASGYMFGKGIYLADISTKSANYCWLSGADHGLLLLCEAELGSPTLRLKNADYDAGKKAKEQGYTATTGLGITTPESWIDAEIVHADLKGVLMPDPTKLPKTDNATDAYMLQYNEYIVYNEAQVRLRYLIRFQNTSDYDIL